MILLISTAWPERALVRAQLEEDTQQQVIGVDTPEAALEWLATARFALVILETQGISPDSSLVETLRRHKTPVLLVTGAFDRAEWEPITANLNVRSTITRPVLIGEVSRAARVALKPSRDEHSARENDRRGP